MVAAAVCVTVILVRIVWVMGYVAVARWGTRESASPNPLRPSFRIGAVIAWCGMRGIVTLAAALALPDGGPGRFPYRDLILFTAFCVVLVTLVVQGMTVSPLMRVLKIHDDGSVEREVRLARAETARAALAAVHDTESKPELVPLLRHKYETRLRRAETGTGEDYTALHRKAQAAERRILSDLRTNGVIGDDAFHRVEEELDWAELNIEGMAREN
jgi:CPA1 family monovalent cation:H+ antiporter